MPETASAAAHVEGLAAKLRAAIGAALSPGAYALVDFPFHANIGDSAIWAGELTALREIRGHGPAYVAHAGSPPEELGRFLPEGGTILLSGGGNFGDLWPVHQRYRERIVALYPHHRIVQLPQSIHYDDPRAAARARRILAAHPDFHLMLRDRRSVAFAAAHLGIAARLVPDAAMCLGPRDATGPATTDLQCLLRRDQERRADAGTAAAHFPGAPVADWARLDAAYWRGARRRMRLARRLPGLPGLGTRGMALRRGFFERFAHAHLDLGLRQLARSRWIVTDRLHGHILATLLNRPHVVIDNSHGKIARFIEAWGTAPGVHVARDYREAGALVRTLGHHEPDGIEAALPP
ncbi:polysaccharide pyruvyl transferase family protein [Limimaricola sp.]|uniref:polysaccharide pyruvyl transferase family protein n=1 Tax=Limimaricola sp. TaxID=2211665 RepID=UPI00405913E9